MTTPRRSTRAGWTADERRQLRALRTPERIQELLDGLAYNKETSGETCRSARRVLRDRTAHCLEGALLAAAARELAGEPPLLLDLVAVRDDDHVLALHRRNGRWGAMAKSNYTGLRFREAIHRTVRELAVTYFEGYFNLDGEKTLRSFSRPFDLRSLDHPRSGGPLDWRTGEEELFGIGEILDARRHEPILSAGDERRLARVTPLMQAAGELGGAK